MIRTRIIGTGSYVPPDILTNDNLSEMVDTSDEWIRTRTGICNRHIAKDMDNADMAYNAARNAVEDARIEASKIGLIIVATSTPDYAFPNQASLVQAKLKAVNAMCFDVSAACSGFITALILSSLRLTVGSLSIVCPGTYTLAASFPYLSHCGSVRSILMDLSDANTLVLVSVTIFNKAYAAIQLTDTTAITEHTNNSIFCLPFIQCFLSLFTLLRYYYPFWSHESHTGKYLQKNQ